MASRRASGQDAHDVKSAGTLNCYSCGAPVVGDAPNCQHCNARLATVSCPSCFGMMFTGARFCPHCGSASVRWQAGGSSLPCPSCETPMLQGSLGDLPLNECGKCYGIWLCTDTFDRICRDAEVQARVLAGPAPAPPIGTLAPVRYLRCPQCREMMHRVNFGRASGVVIDVCREHGTWFDMNELHRITQFIRAGGMQRAREKQTIEMQNERRRLQAARLGEGRSNAHSTTWARADDDLLWLAASAAGTVIRHLFK